MTRSVLDITGDIRSELVLPVPAKVQERLSKQNEQAIADARAKSLPDPELVPVPAEVVLQLVESSIEERRLFGDREKILKAKDQPEEFLLELIMARAAEGTDERVVRQLVNVMVPSAVAKVTHACMHGELPKATGGNPTT